MHNDDLFLFKILKFELFFSWWKHVRDIYTSLNPHLYIAKLGYAAAYVFWLQKIRKIYKKKKKK